MVLRASTDNTLDDLERAVDDGVNAYRVSLLHNAHDSSKPCSMAEYPCFVCVAHA